MPTRSEIDPSARHAAELKVKEMQAMDAELQIAIAKTKPFPQSYFTRRLSQTEKQIYYGNSPSLAHAIWVNPQEAQQEDKPYIIITQEGIQKTAKKYGITPDINNLNQLSFAEYKMYFQKGMDLLKGFSQLHALKEKAQKEPQNFSADNLKDLFHLIYKTAGGDEKYKESSMDFQEQDLPILQIIIDEPQADSIGVSFYDGITDDSGEQFNLSMDGQAWEIGIQGAFYSRTLNHSFRMENGEDDCIYSPDSLTEEQMAQVGLKVADTYIRLRSQGILPTFSI